MKTKEEILSLLKRHKPFFEAHFGVQKIGLFGSYAKGKATDASDIDLLVDMPGSFDAYYDLKDFLQDTFQTPVDLGLESSLRTFVRRKIENEIIYV